MKFGLQVKVAFVSREPAPRASSSRVVMALGLACLFYTPAPLGAADPIQLLAEAERLADVYNWYDAHPLYSQAEVAFRQLGDQRNALFAQASRLRGEMQVRALSDVIASIDSILASEAARVDKQLRLRCLVVRGDVNLEIDAPAAKDDWDAALALAAEIGDRKWQNRANGELGMIAFMLGDTGTALSQVSQALFAATATGD